MKLTINDCSIVLFSYLLLISQAATAQTISIATEMAAPASRFFGTTGGEEVGFGVLPLDASPMRTRMLPYSDTPADQYRPRAVIAGPPLIEPRGIVRGDGFLFISDSGRDETHDEPATIWRVDPSTGDIQVFYRGDFLISSKWLFYLQGAGDRPDEVIVSDFGEEPELHQEGTGVGAKIFAIEVLPNGEAGAIRVLHEGPPFRSPQGVTVVGDQVIVADVGAGEVRNRSDAPDVEFVSGAIFQVPLAGGEPRRIFEDHTFVTLVGVCVFSEGGDQYLRIWDIDGGRLDDSEFAWMPHSGYAAQYRAQVENLSPLEFGPIQTVAMVEEFPVTLDFESVSGQSVVLHGIGETTFGGRNRNLVLSTVTEGQATVIVESPTFEPALTFEAVVTSDEGEVVTQSTITVPKDVQALTAMRDNKHAGAAVILDDLMRLDATVDGISRTLSLFPPSGGISTLVWQGAPFVTPMGTQYSWDGQMLWVTDLNGGPDRTGAIWEVPVPSAVDRASMYSPGNAWELPPTVNR